MPKSGMPPGALPMLILRVLHSGSLHGYAIAQRIQQISRDVLQIQQGSLYPALYRLEERGYIQAEWHESDQGRMAKYYSITRKGAKQLAVDAAEWERTAAAVALVLQAVK